jgi:hypothetical protein
MVIASEMIHTVIASLFRSESGRRAWCHCERGATHPTAPLPDTIVRNEIATAALARPRDDIMGKPRSEAIPHMVIARRRRGEAIPRRPLVPPAS